MYLCSDPPNNRLVVSSRIESSGHKFLRFRGDNLTMEATPTVEVHVVIIGAGPAGLATSACLNYAHVPNIVLEKENVCAPLWKRRAYDRLKLHLAKEFCSLPHMSLPRKLPQFVPRADFIDYLDNYAMNFHVEPYYNWTVTSASYNQAAKRWRIEVRNTKSGGEEYETYHTKFLVVATGENGEAVIPNVPGLDSFSGEWMHSSAYNNGQRFTGKDVLVVGCGNSGMEISYDLSNYRAKTSIVIRNPVCTIVDFIPFLSFPITSVAMALEFCSHNLQNYMSIPTIMFVRRLQVHVLTKGIVYLGMNLLKCLSMSVVDNIVVFLSSLKYCGTPKKYGIKRPKEGPFLLKAKTGRTPTIDVGAMKRIRKGKIKVILLTINHSNQWFKRSIRISTRLLMRYVFHICVPP